jgi:solute carrier family 25 phosphate transporter 3
MYKSNTQAWKMIYAKEGLRGVFFGWSPTFIGYSMQGAGKYGFYEGFKYLYGEKLAPNVPKQVVFLAASASAEFLADLALCPMEAIKVRMQTTLPPFANNLREGWSKVIREEGVGGLYKGLYPLWARQIPYTMVKFATFEETVSRIYGFLGKPKDSYNGLQQTGVSFLGGYIAGIFCAVVSHPAGTSSHPLHSTILKPSTNCIKMSWSRNSTTTAKPARARVKRLAGSTAKSDLVVCGTDCPPVSS